ncbi:hypothetical protein HDV02_002994 [Globomyces sp. JEL0801]|nr:hypothetical protein HDV02_002994 [Globomyces sp. JEL0801]
MAGRENSEADLLDLHMRQMVYQNKTTYSFECGGLTQDIANLTNAEIQEYHKQFYHLNNTTVVICGLVNPMKFLDSLLLHPIFSKLNVDELQSLPQHLPSDIHPPPYSPNHPSFSTKTVSFPSEDESSGSISYGWRGPPSEDAKTIIALEVLASYFNDNPSCILPQVFTESVTPLASDIDISVKSYIDTSIFLIFSGVELNDQAKDDDDDDDEDSQSDADSDESMESSSDDAMSDTETEKRDLYEPRYFYTILKKCIEDFVNNGFPTTEGMLPMLKREYIKIQEALESSPHEMPASYWQNLAKTFFLDNPVCEVMMRPDSKLAKELSDKVSAEEEERKKIIGTVGLEAIKNNVALAVKENEINLSNELLLSMPDVPDASKVGRIPIKMENIDFSDHSPEFPFSVVQVVHTETSFCHLGVGLNISQLPMELRPFLVLFQELIFQTPMEFISDSGEKIAMSYQEVTRYASELFVSHSCGVGFGNSLFSTSSLNQLFTMFTTSQPTDFERMIRFAIQSLLFSEFTTDRILTIAKNLSSNIVDNKRNGEAVLSSVVNKICCPESMVTTLGSNEAAISIFSQESFLKTVIADCKNGNEKKIIGSLNTLRSLVACGDRSTTPSFLRLAVPFKFSLNRSTIESSTYEIAKDCERIWTSEVAQYESVQTTLSKRDSRHLGDHVIQPFPFPRIPYSIQHLDPQFSKSVLVPVSGLGSSYMSQFVPCDLIRQPRHPDYFPTVLFAELLSRTEGPLYVGIRGLGYAYGASLNCYIWAGQISFDLYRASEPQKALNVFYDILSSMSTPEGFSKLCNEFDIKTSQCSIAYRWVSHGSTADTLIATSLRSSLQGYANLDDYTDFIEDLYKVTVKDLQRVYELYFKQFLSDSVRATVLITTAGDQVDTLKSSFKQLSPVTPESYQIDFKQFKLSDFSC